MTESSIAVSRHVAAVRALPLARAASAALRAAGDTAWRLTYYAGPAPCLCAWADAIDALIAEVHADADRVPLAERHAHPSEERKHPGAQHVRYCRMMTREEYQP